MNLGSRIMLVVVLAAVAIGLLLQSMDRHYRFFPESAPSAFSVENLVNTAKSEWWLWAFFAAYFIIAAVVDVVNDRRGNLDDDEQHRTD